MSILPVTSIFAAFAALALVLLSGFVTLRRIAIRAPVGDAPDDILRRRVRAQGNFIEYVPLALLCLALVEGGGAPGWLPWALGGALAVGRALHAAGMLSASTPLRVAGMVLTYSMLLVAAGRLAVTAAASV